MRKILGIIILITILLSCHTTFTNPADPKSDNYPGYPTVDSLTDFASVYPVNGSTSTLTLNKILCTKLLNAELYHAQIATDVEFTDIIFENDESTLNEIDTTAVNFYSIGTFYIRFRVFFNSIWSDWTDAVSYTITMEESSWSGIIPVDNGSTGDTKPLLNWNDVVDAVSYEVQYDTVNGTTGTVIAVSSSQYQISTALTLGETGYWRIRIVNDDGIAGSWSAVWSFEVSLLSMVTVIPEGGSGSFSMGSSTDESNETPVHTVNLTVAYTLSETEITQKQYVDVVGVSNPASEYGVGDNYPVYNINWYDALIFCNMLSEDEGYVACYYTDSSFTNIYISGTTVYCNWEANGYRLPTEAEWEYAALGGASSNGYPYSGSKILDDVAWYLENANGSTHEVKGLQANELGLYDMSGNLFEWCWDWYGSDYYSSSPSDNPKGPPSGLNRVIRGSHWWCNASSCRSTYRDSGSVRSIQRYVGFRVVRLP